MTTYETKPVRLSRMARPIPTSITTTSAAVAHGGSRRASQKPSIIAAMSDMELTMLSP